MSQQKIFEFYERVYFHEIEHREKINARLQIPLVITLSIISIYVYIARGISFNNYASDWFIIFIIIFAISLIIFIVGAYNFTRAYCYGYTYEFIPTSGETESYRNKLIDTYKTYEESKELVEKHLGDYLLKYYIECSTIISQVNDERSLCIYKSNIYVIRNIIPLVITFLIFTFSGIDKNSSKKEYTVKLTSPVEITSEILNSIYIEASKKQDGVNIMNDKPKPPPPPPSPPPRRIVKEDIKTPTRTPSKGK